MKRILTSLLFLVVITSAQEFNFIKFATENGLSLSQVSALEEHPNGTIIIGTYGGGIDFYDGSQFQNISIKDGLSSNLIYSLILTDQNNLLIGTSKGLDSYSSNGTVKRYLFKEFNENIIWKFIKDDNKIWICSENGLFQLQNDSLKSIIKDVRIFDAVKTDSTILFTSNKGLISLRNQNDYVILDKFKNEFIISIVHSRSGKIYLGTSNGLIEYYNKSIKRYTTKDGLIHDDIYSLAEDSKGNLWVGTEKGLDKLVDGKFDDINRNQGINEYRIWTILEDKNLGLWFGTDAGLYYLYDDNFKLYRQFNNIPLDVWSIAKHDQLYFGTHQQGILKFDGNNFTKLKSGNLFDGKIIRTICFDQTKNNMLIGTDRGFYKYSLNDNSFEKIEYPQDKLDYDIINIFVDSKSRIWISTIFNGLYRISNNNLLQKFSSVDSITLNSSYKIQEDQNNILWIATEAGIVKFKNDNFSIPKSLEEFKHKEILSIKLGKDNRLWAGCYSEGVYEIDISDTDNPHVVRLISTKDGLNDNSILALLEDNDKLWVGTNFGINLIDLNLYNNDKNFIKSFTKYNGFPGLEFVQNVIFKENDNSIWFGTIKGLVNFDPNKIEVNKSSPNIYISKFVVKSQDSEISYLKNPLASTLLSEEIELDHKQNNISIEFKSASFPVSENILYQYRMGDDSWSKPTNESSVNFYNLPPKDYSFEVRSIKDGITSVNSSLIKFSIATPFWLSTWFYILLTGILMIVAYFAYIYRVNLLSAKNKELQRRIEERKKYQEQLEIWQKELISAKELAEKSDRLKSEFLAQMSHEIRTPINSILNFSYLLKESLSDKVDEDLREAFSIIDRGGKRLIRTIDSILNMSQIQVGSFETKMERLNLLDIIEGLYLEFKQSIVDKGLSLKLNNHCKSSIIIADEYTSSQIFANLFDNAFKYTPSGSIEITVFNPDEKHVAVSIKDTGIGISEEKIETVFHPFSQEESGYTRKYEGVGLGLALVKKYCELNDSEISVKSKKGVGTTFTVIYKLPQNSLE